MPLRLPVTGCLATATLIALAPLATAVPASAVFSAAPGSTGVVSSAPGSAGAAPKPGDRIDVLSLEKAGKRLRSYLVTTPSLEHSAVVPLRVDVLLPDGYRRHRNQRYPVLYALPGTSNTAHVWTRNIPTEELTAGRDLIVVIPDGTFDADGGGFYTNWVDQTTSRGVADWETFHTEELLDWVDRRFRTVDERAGRAIVGISQGGFGSMSYAARHPEQYGAAASFSGATSIFEGPLCRVFAPPLIAAIMTGLNQVQPFAPFGDPVLDADNWRAHDPASIVAELAGTRVDIYTSTGLPGESDLGDPAAPGTVALEAILHQSNQCFRTAADAAGIDYHWNSYLQGTHAWAYGRRSLQHYLPRLMRFFERR